MLNRMRASVAFQRADVWSFNMDIRDASSHQFASLPRNRDGAECG
jgi:hypothetical protein